MPPEAPQILIIDDDHSSSAWVRHTLSEADFQADVLPSGPGTLAAVERIKPQLILLRPDTQETDGFELCRRLRLQTTAPIIALLPEEHRTDTAVAVAVGADDCCAVPCPAERLLLLLRTHLQRSQTPETSLGDHVAVEQLEIDCGERSVCRAGQPIELSGAEWAVLELLVRNAGRLVPSDRLEQRLRGLTASAPAVALQNCIRQLRAKLEDEPDRPRLVLSIAQLGYAFTGRLQRLPTTSRSAAPSAPQNRARMINFPHLLTSFVGRTAEVNLLRSLLARQDVRLVTLHGPGGSGKTRLAIEAAARLGDLFEDGIYFVALATISDPSLVAPHIAQSLGIKEGRGASLLATLKQHLAERQCLLVLDNFEQLLDATGLLGDLLASVPELKVLVTSRALLQVSGERAFPVLSLPLPGLQDLPTLEALAESPAVTLFIDRAQSIKPDFALTPQNARAIAEICHYLDGLPLAIELAAARCNILSPQLMLDRFHNRLKLLTGGSKDLPQRHQALRSTIDWSYNLLSQRERRLFTRLSVFAGGWSLEAAEAICDADGILQGDLLDLLGSLLDQSMIRRVEGIEQGCRFVMLETIRAYALDQLESSGEAPSIHRLHALHYLQLAEQALQDSAESGGQSWLAQIEREQGNLRAALNWSLASRETTVGLRFVAALWKFWHTHNYHEEGSRFMRAVLAQAGQEPSALQVQAYYGAGWLAYDQAQYDEATRLFETGLELAQRCGDKHSYALLLHGIGEMAQTQRDHTRARQCFESSLGLLRELNDPEEVAWSIDHLGRLARDQRNYREAQQLFTESLALFRTLQHTWGMIVSLYHLGDLLYLQGYLDQTQIFLDECLQLSRETGEMHNLIAALTLNRLSEIAFYKGNRVAAHAMGRESLLLGRMIFDSNCISVALEGLGRIATAEGHYDEALRYFEENWALEQKRRDVVYIASLLEGIAGLALARGLLLHATRMYAAAEALREPVGAARWLHLNASYQRNIQDLRTQLTPDAFETAWEEGRALDLEHLLKSQVPLQPFHTA